jgi:hypothetical protein
MNKSNHDFKVKNILAFITMGMFIFKFFCSYQKFKIYK